MRILIIGNTATEHVLSLISVLSPLTEKVFCINGNPGISELVECINISITDEYALDSVIDFSLDNNIDCIINNNNKLIQQGWNDAFLNNNISVFGATKESNKLDWSKYFLREFSLRRDIPSPKYAAFEKKEFAIAYAHSQQLPFVIKSNNSTTIRNSSTVHSHEGAIGAIKGIFDNQYNDCVLVEEYLEGTEYTIPLIVNGNNYGILPAVQLYSHLYDHNNGPLTEGMAAVNANLPTNTLKRINDEIINPLIKGLVEEGREYIGLMSLTILIDKQDRLFLLNAHAGYDPLVASTALLLLDIDFIDMVQRIIDNIFVIDETFPVLPTANLQNASSVAVSLCSEGYPNTRIADLPIKFHRGLERMPHSRLIDKHYDIQEEYNGQVFLLHNSTNVDDNNNLITGAGRIFVALGLADNTENAHSAITHITKKIEFPGKYMRCNFN